MAPSRDWHLRVRIAGALALVVGFNGLLLAVSAWSVLTVVTLSGRSVPIDFGLVLSAGMVLLGAIGLTVVQARYGSRAVVSDLDLERVEGDGPRSVGGRVRRLAALANVGIPSVAIADRPEPVSLTIGPQRSPTIVLTTELLEQLDDEELDAVLAHEVAHIGNRDIPIVTAVAAIVSIGDQLRDREALLRRILVVTGRAALLSGVSLLVFALPILVLGICYLVVSTISRTLLAINAVALGMFAKTREYAADRAACELTGNPAALASALETLDGTCPERDVRLEASATVGIVANPLSIEAPADSEEHWLEPWLPDPGLFGVSDENRVEPSDGPINQLGIRLGAWIRATVVTPVKTRIRALYGWRPATHPPTESRIDKLRSIERSRRQ